MDKNILYYGEMDTPVGPLLILKHQDKVVRIDFGKMKSLETKLTKWANRYVDQPKFVQQIDRVHDVIKELDDYFHQKRQTFSFDMKLYGTPFQQKVWQALLDTIPYGK